jgi:hypothetical protein
MERTKAILAAGGLTVIVLISFLVISLGNGRSGVSTAVAPAVLVQPASNQAAMDSAAQQTIAQWQTYSRQLEEAVQAMQVRELEYRTQLEAANQTIQQLQMQLSTQGRSGNFESHDGDDF